MGEASEIAELKAQVKALKEENGHQRRFENRVKLAAGLFAIVTFAWGVWQYRGTQRGQFQQRFWEERYKLYSEACQAAASIATAKSVEDTEMEQMAFWRLYWGRLSIVENRGVKDAMVAYGRELSNVQKGKSKPDSLRLLSYTLARECRMSLQQTWEPVDLDDLPAAPATPSPASTP